MNEQPRFGVAHLATPLFALFIVNVPHLYGLFLSSKLRFQQLTGTWDTLAVVLSASFILLAAGAIALLYAEIVNQHTESISCLILAAAVAGDYYLFHRPLLTYLAALAVAARVYRLSNTPRRVPMLLILLVVSIVPIVGYATPLRFVAFATALLLLVGAVFNIRENLRDLALSSKPLTDLDFSLDCLLFLTVGGFAWSQSMELLGSIPGTALYLPMGIIIPFALRHALVQPETAVVVFVDPRLSGPTQNLRAFLNASGVKASQPASTRPKWNDINSYLSTSAYSAFDEDHQPIYESGHLFLGLAHDANNVPVLLDRNILSEHIHILGRSGSGKTSLGIIPLLTQLIRGHYIPASSESEQRPSDAHPIVIVDLKGDPALFNTAREEAAAKNQKFLFFTADTDKPSYYFNPFAAFQNDHLSVPTVTQSLLDALNLNHGEGYGRSYFTRVSRQRLLTVLNEKGLPTSFQDLYQKLTAVPASDKKHVDDAFELQAAIESFLLYPQLFTTAEQDRSHPDTIINFNRVLEERQVVYFWLPAATQSMAAREIGKLALFNLFAAAKLRQDEYLPSRQVYLVIDEFQRLVGENLNIILEQARSYGIGAVLANQTAAQLKTADGKDLWPLINGNTAATLHFGTKDINELEMLSRLSGEVLQATETVSLSQSRGNSFNYKSGFGESEGESETISRSTRYVPRLTVGDLQRVFSNSRQFLLSVQKNTGFSRFNGAPVVVDGMFSMDKDTYARRRSERWPEIPNLPKGILTAPKTAFAKTRPSQEMLDKIRLLTQDH